MQRRSRADLGIGALTFGERLRLLYQPSRGCIDRHRFESDTRGVVCHRAYHDFYGYKHFSDIEFVYGRALHCDIIVAMHGN